MINHRSRKGKNVKWQLAAALLMAVPLGAAGQTAVVSAGGTAADASHTLSYSVGQVAVQAATTTDGRLTEGVLQPIAVKDVSIEGAEDPWRVVVFPNPTTMGITLRREVTASPASVRLYSLEGRLLHFEQWHGASLTLDLNAMAAGVYMLQVDNRTYKITKQ